MTINANVTNQQITASVGETRIDVSVSGGVGPTGATGAAAPVTLTGDVTGTGTGTIQTTIPPGTVTNTMQAPMNFGTVKARLTLQGAPGRPEDVTLPNFILGLALKASDITDFTTAVVAAAPPTTDASLLTSGTIPDARMSSAIARTSDITAAVANVVNAAPASLDTLRELADALGNDASFSATVTNSLAAKAPLASPTFTGTVNGITKSMVGLGSVDNTADTAKPVSTATQTALDSKAALSHTHSAADLTSGTVATARLGSGSASASTFLRGDGTWAAPDSSGDSVLRALFVPPAPTSLTAGSGNAQATLSWSAPTVIAQAPITDYVVQFSSDSGSTWTTFSDGTSTATSATVTGLSNGTAYVFRVAAVNAVGTGSYTAASSAVTPSESNLTKAASGPFATATGSGTTASPLAWSGTLTTTGLNILFTAAASGTLNLSLTLTGGCGDFGCDVFEVTRNGSVVFTPALGNAVTRTTTFSVSSGDVIRLNIANEYDARLTAFSASI
jgi:hypothetical protein